jgi:monoamine oxidase
MNVEGGGELIGSNHPTWVACKESLGLEFLDVSESEELESPLILAGKRLSEAESGALWEEMDEALKGINADSERVNADEPWTTPGAISLDGRATSDWLRALECSDLCRLGLRTQFEADNGVSLERQSYLGNLTAVKGGGLEKYWTESEVYRCKGGNQQLATILATKIGESRIKLGMPVQSITDRGDKLIVKTQSGQSVEADDVVLSVPPSVWSKIEFGSGLIPPGLKPQMGTNVKYLSVMRGAFWKAAALSPDSLADSDISMTWDGTDGQTGGGACLVSFSGGPAAERCRSRSGPALGEAYAKELDARYKGYRESFVGSRFMDWPSDAWVGAGYSFPAPGEVCAMGPLMNRPSGALHFAGEHTCYKFVGYMEGALSSGVTVAERIARRDGRAK